MAKSVHGVIRGIGLSNDGRRKGLLAPDAEGQSEAMRRAYRAAGIAPETLGFLECHATGTPTGDSVEIRASVDVFAKTDSTCRLVRLKANTGHLITVAGLASLLKLTRAMTHETLPPMPLSGPVINAFDRHQLWCLKSQGGTLAHSKIIHAEPRSAISGLVAIMRILILEQYQADKRGCFGDAA